MLNLFDFVSGFSQPLRPKSKIGERSALAPFLLSLMHLLRFLDCHQP
jgi:hypothetical protein